MSNLKVNTINDASGGSAAVLYGVASPPNSMGFRNRIINGEMRIDQRNAGASVNNAAAGSGLYTTDRWLSYGTAASKFSFQQNAGAVTPPVGFSNYLGVTSLSAYSVPAGEIYYIAQRVEGFNVADFAFGTAAAVSVTLSFWVRSSLTGTFGGAANNGAGNRSYPFTYTISAANTWEQKTVTIAGETGGTWLTNNGIGLQLVFSLGSGSSFSGAAGSWSANTYTSATGATSVVGTSGATFYITGVQLEAGTVASPFERRDYGRELMMCQRYFSQLNYAGALSFWLTGYAIANDYLQAQLTLPVTMRAQPTLTTNINLTLTNTAGPDIQPTGQQTLFVRVRAVSTGLVSAYNASAYQISASSEL